MNASARNLLGPKYEDHCSVSPAGRATLTNDVHRPTPETAKIASGTAPDVLEPILTLTLSACKDL
jgi:hypothetical protein